MNVTYLGNGYYSCLWNVSNYVNGSYNVRMNATNVTFHNNGTFLKGGAFGVNVPPNAQPVLTVGTVNPNPGPWGSNFNFSVNITDEDIGQNVTVSFWYSPNGNDPWTLIDQEVCEDNCTSGNILTIYFNKSDYGCADIGTRYYKFNATDNSSEANADSEVHGPFSFTLQKNDVEFINPFGDSGTVNRSGSQTILLGIQINDTTRNALVNINVTKGKFWVTYDDTNYDSGSGDKSSNSSSYISYSFNPTCTPLKYNASSSQKWKVGVLDDTCYNNANSSVYGLTIMGDLENYILPLDDTVYNDLENVTVFGNITSDCLDDVIDDADVTFRVSHDGSEYIADFDPAGYNQTFYNATWNVTEGPSGNYSIIMNSSGSFYNTNTTTLTHAFHHQRSPRLPDSSTYVSPVSAEWGNSFGFYTNITDDDDNVTVYMWRRCTGGNTSTSTPIPCSPTSNFSLYDTKSCNDCNNDQVTFTVSTNLPSEYNNNKGI